MERVQAGSKPSLIQLHQTPSTETPFLGSAIPTNPFPSGIAIISEYHSALFMREVFSSIS